MAKRPFPHHVFRARSKQIGIEYEKPPYSKGFKRLIAQNVEAITLFTCRDFIRTMGLPVAALAPLQTSVERFFRGDLSPRIDEISADDAKLLVRDDWWQISRELTKLVAKTPQTKGHWFLSIGSDIEGKTAFKVWPIVISEPTAPFCPPRDVLYDEIEVMILERFAVILNMRGLPEPWVKL